MNKLTAMLHPVPLVRLTGIMDGVSLLVLLGIAMPLKYWADMPLAVTICGTAHGGIFVLYALAVLYAQLRLRWHPKWTLYGFLAAFIPGGNFVLDRMIRKNRATFVVRPIPLAWLVYAVVLYTFIDLFTQLPVMSTFAASLGASATVAGFVVGLYSLSNMFGNVLAGWMTDRFGATPAVIRAGLLASGCVLLLYGLVSHVPELIAVRFLHGLLSGLIAPAAFTYLANQTKAEKQGSQSAVTGSFVGIAAIVGPAYSGIMAGKTSVPFVFATIAAIGLILFLLAVKGLKSSGKTNGKQTKTKQKLVVSRPIVQALSGAFFLMFSQGALAYLLPLHLESLGYDSRLSGMLLSTFGLVAVALFALPTNRMFDNIQPIISFAVGLGLMGLSQIGLGQNTDATIFYLIMAMYGVGFAFLFPAINTLLARATTKDNRGQAYGLFYALFSMGTVAGSAGVGMLPLAIPGQFAAAGSILLLCAASVLLTNRLRLK